MTNYILGNESGFNAMLVKNLDLVFSSFKNYTLIQD